MSTRIYFILSLGLLLIISGCSWFSGKDKSDYRKSRTSKALEAPPELVIPPADSSYTVSEVVRASEIEGDSTSSKKPAVSVTSVVPEYENVTIEKEGQTRWLSAKASPEQLWQPLLDFWQDQDVKLEEINRELGVMQTEWKSYVKDEARGKISSFFSKALSNVGAGDLREQYRLRIERDEDGSNIYLTYQAREKVFEELPSGEAGPARWQLRTSDPEAEALMLKRIQQYIAKL